MSQNFEFLGYRIFNTGIFEMAKKTIANFINKTVKLYEQGASLERISRYLKRCYIWILSCIPNS